MSFQQNPAIPAHPSSSQSVKELLQTFNSALISSQNTGMGELSRDLDQIMESKEIGAILDTVRRFAVAQGITDLEASERLLVTLRRLDTTWKSILMQEGISSLGRAGIEI